MRDKEDRGWITFEGMKRVFESAARRELVCDACGQRALFECGPLCSPCWDARQRVRREVGRRLRMPQDREN